MLKLLTSSQMRQADAFTIKSRSIDSMALMETAAEAFVSCFKDEYPNLNSIISIYCGTGNNGGDGLVIARLLEDAGYLVNQVIIARFSEKSSREFDVNFLRLKEYRIPIREITRISELEQENADILIDALLGSGLNKSLSGEWAALVHWLNKLGKNIVSVDIPTGFKAEGPVGKDELAVVSNLTITFQRPKINFFLPESAGIIKTLRVVPIGLDEAFMQKTEGSEFLLMDVDIRKRLKNRSPFSHKGTFGHALIIAGEVETMGAALLSAKACVYSGAGLTTACIPAAGLTALNTRIPEVMAVLRKEGIPLTINWATYQALGVGPGIGISHSAYTLFTQVLREYKRPLVLDADALNLISANYELMQILPEGSVLTPHVKEFDRLFGDHQNWWERIETGKDRAATLGCTIVLKNRYTMIFTSKGKCLFNPTGCASMSTGGMGDVLTGMITSFIAQGYSPEDAAILAVYIHGAAGEQTDDYVVPPSALIKKLPAVISDYLT